MISRSKKYIELELKTEGYSFSENKDIMKVVKQTQSLRVPYGTITSSLKYANTLPGWQMGKVSREEMVRKFSRHWEKKVNLALFQVVMEVCCVDKEWISVEKLTYFVEKLTYFVEKLTYFVEKYHSYVKLNNNHFKTNLS